MKYPWINDYHIHVLESGPLRSESERYFAYVQEIPKQAFYALGATVPEATAKLREGLPHFLETLEGMGTPIPVPDEDWAIRTIDVYPYTPTAKADLDYLRDRVDTLNNMQIPE